jgi:Cu2+-exporting ATPase
VPSEFAERAVPPALATASLGFLVGDATVAAAVLRPDYATGPGIGGSAMLIERLGACFDEGIVVRRPDVFHQMAQADLVLLDHDPSLTARVLELEDVHVAGELSPDAILEYAECAVRQFHDPRARAVAVAFAFQGGMPLSFPVRFRLGGVEFNDGARRIRVDGFAGGRIADGDGMVPDRCAPLRVYVNDDLAGWLTFYEGVACAAATPVFDLRTRCGMQVELLAPDAAQPGLADALGVDEVHVCVTDAAKAQLIRTFRRQGRRVVYVGNCRQNPQAAAIANLAVFPAPDLTWDADPAGVWLLQPFYEKLVQLRDVARSMRHQEQLHFNLILIPNVVCVAGALLFGLTSLAVVVLSNLGTFSVYSRSRAALERTQRRLRERRQRIPDQPRGGRPDETSRQLILRET